MVLSLVNNGDSGLSARTKLNAGLTGYNNLTLSVKDFGAVGDGSTNDTAAIQACFDAAFGTVSSPHGNANAALNRPVYFPAGTYSITSTLNLRSVLGGHIYGAGMSSVTLVWNGSYAGGTTLTSMVYINGMANSTIEEMSFIMGGPGAAPTTYNSVCLNWDWDNTGTVNTTAVTFKNLAFGNCTTGLLMGNSGYECDNALVINVTGNNLWYGIETNNGNCIGHTVIGGGFSGFFGAGFYVRIGSITTMVNVSFASGNNPDAYDINVNSPDPLTIIGGRTESAHFLQVLPQTGLVTVSGVLHESSAQGHFCWCGSSVIIDSCFSLNGDLDGKVSQGQFLVRNSIFYRYDYLPAPSFLTSVYKVELDNCWIGNPQGLARKIVRQCYTAAQGTRTYDIEAASLSDPQFLYESYSGQGLPTVGAQSTYLTITIASPAVITLGQHWFQAGLPVVFTTDGALPTGITAGTVYWISTAGLTTNTFQIADTSAHALAGTNSVVTSGTQSGNQSMYLVRTYAVGDTVLKNNVAAGGSPGWVCTTAGLSVGVAVFKAIANIAA